MTSRTTSKKTKFFFSFSFFHLKCIRRVFEFSSLSFFRTSKSHSELASKWEKRKLKKKSISYLSVLIVLQILDFSNVQTFYCHSCCLISCIVFFFFKRISMLWEWDFFLRTIGIFVIGWKKAERNKKRAFTKEDIALHVRVYGISFIGWNMCDIHTRIWAAGQQDRLVSVPGRHGQVLLNVLPRCAWQNCVISLGHRRPTHPYIVAGHGQHWNKKGTTEKWMM